MAAVEWGLDGRGLWLPEEEREGVDYIQAREKKETKQC